MEKKLYIKWTNR